MNHVIILSESVTSKNALSIYRESQSILKKADEGDQLRIDFSNVDHIDSAGVTVIERIRHDSEDSGLTVDYIAVSEDVDKTLQLFKRKSTQAPKQPIEMSLTERLGQHVYYQYLFLKDFVVLLSDFMYYAVRDTFKKTLRRKGEVVRQSIFIGVNALPIVALIAFLVGFILALQSANQLRQFGANIFVADLVTVAMVSEMGPLITAIIIAGRSGSSIAAEIATMKVSEEIDVLKTMGINPIPYLFVPKLYAISMMMPMLTIIANFIGIFGGAIIGYFYLDISFVPFYNEVFSILRYKEIIVALIKSYVFAVLIVITAVHFGMRAFGGPERVGKATTDSVVTSIFFVILADTMIGLIFYFN